MPEGPTGATVECPATADLPDGSERCDLLTEERRAIEPGGAGVIVGVAGQAGEPQCRGPRLFQIDSQVGSSRQGVLVPDVHTRGADPARLPNWVESVDLTLDVVSPASTYEPPVDFFLQSRNVHLFAAVPGMSSVSLKISPV